jgi:hypothetical protein
MGACPFCKGEVDSDILTFGGRCSSCLIEIPGEEAPTDPGAAARAAQAAAEAAAAKKSPAGLIVGGLVVLLAIAGGSWAAFGPVEEPLPDIPTGSEAYKKVSSQFIKFDLDDEPEEPIETAGASKSATPSTARKPATKSTPASTGKTGSATASSAKSASPGANLPDTTNLGAADDGLDDIDNIPLATANDVAPDAPKGPEAVAMGGNSAPVEQVDSVLSKSGGSGGGSLLADVGGGPRQRLQGEEYCGEEMREPVKMIMKQLGQQLRSCGDRMLKKDDRFSASVKVSIAVQKTGQIAVIDLQSLKTDDAEFLGCIEKTIKRTSFPRFCTGLDLAKTYYFGSQR